MPDCLLENLPLQPAHREHLACSPPALQTDPLNSLYSALQSQILSPPLTRSTEVLCWNEWDALQLVTNWQKKSLSEFSLWYWVQWGRALCWWSKTRGNSRCFYSFSPVAEDKKVKIILKTCCSVPHSEAGNPQWLYESPGLLKSCPWFPRQESVLRPKVHQVPAASLTCCWMDRNQRQKGWSHRFSLGRISTRRERADWETLHVSKLGWFPNPAGKLEA